MLVAWAAASPAAPEGTEVLSERYRLASEGPKDEAEEWSRVLEAAWPQFEAFFGAAPKLGEGERLRVAVYETVEAWKRGISDAGGAVPGDGAGGYYDPGSRTAFLYRQPSTWYTRTLLIHEVSHQFHFLARTRNKPPTAGWYTEGLAEHLSHHTWDGKTLRLGVVPRLSLEDRAGAALGTVTAPTFKLEDLVDGKAAGRPESMHLVRFLLAGGDKRRAARFEDVSRKLDQGAAGADSLFARQFGPLKTLLSDWRAWLPTAQEPWTPVHVDWEARGPAALRGRATVVSACRTKAPSSRVSARFVPPPGDWSAGVLLHWSSADDWTVGLVDRGASCRVDRFVKGTWTKFPVKSPGAAGTDGAWDVAAFRRAGKVVFTVNAKEIGDYDLPGDVLGLAVDHSVVDFTDVLWTPTPPR